MPRETEDGATVQADAVRLDRIFGALADPTRRAILARLVAGEATVGQVAAPLAMALPSVSKHVRQLERSGLVARRVEGRRHWLRLSPEGLRTAGEYMDLYRPFWTQSIDRLSRLTASLDGPAPGRRGTPDEDGA